MAEVYKADQELTAGIFRPVALKVIRPEYSESPDFREMFLDEARTACTLSHPNIVHIYEVGEADGLMFMAMELVPGETLATVNRHLREQKERFSDEALFAIGIYCCSALEAVHALKIEGGHVNLVHRDVSPHNLLLSSTGSLKLIDFGIAKAATNRNLTNPGVTKGKAGYFSPEQAMGKLLDGRSDLFSLGVVLYQMLSGSRPFEVPAKDSVRPHAGADRSAAQRIRRDTPASLRERAPHVPRAVERLVMRLLEKSPSERYASATEVLERLQRELRAMTRDEPALVVRGALVLAGFATAEKRPEGSAVSSSRRLVGARRAIVGHAILLLGFVVGVLAIEGGSAARGSLEPGSRPLELVPVDPGGLRVLATPWAYVRVDGQQVETTPFARPIPLAAGKHWITLTHPDAPPVEREVVVTTNETITLDVTMAVGTATDAGMDAR